MTLNSNIKYLYTINSPFFQFFFMGKVKLTMLESCNNLNVVKIILYLVFNTTLIYLFTMKYEYVT